MENSKMKTELKILDAEMLDLRDKFKFDPGFLAAQ
jgi:hypothetical protein